MGRCTPGDVLTALALDSEAVVRQSLCSNRNVGVEVLAALAQDRDADVRRCAEDALAARAENADPRPMDSDAESGLAWDAEVAVHGRAVEEVAWSVVCGGFGGPLADLVAVAVGAVA